MNTQKGGNVRKSKVEAKKKEKKVCSVTEITETLTPCALKQV